ncbi:hypothetical protein HYALB_00012855 [Hymenoscyphus albidus]|uniref:Amidoligase enzyme-domain-containing protein n=1 Tax=Hymenoscyphus albidus TaxID=595503 RepID=A0A9N9LMK3_9HELO|nr:hypothetical protein HYALB_00012855 [Hymenoscyphus albidus]
MAGGYRSRPVSLDQSPHVCGDQLMQTTLFNSRGTLAIYNPSTQDQPSLLSIPATTTTTKTKITATTPPSRGLVIRNHGSCKSGIRYLLCVSCKRMVVACQDPVDDDDEDEDNSEGRDDHNSERDGDEQSGSWALDTDPSLVAPNIRGKDDPNANYHFHRVEICSPILLFTEKSLAAVAEVCGILSSNSRIHLNASCGLHVHIGNGMDVFAVETLSKLMATVFTFEPTIDKIHPAARRNYPRICPMAPGLRIRDLFELVCYQDRDAAITNRMAYNIVNLLENEPGKPRIVIGGGEGLIGVKNSKKTIEFRQHAGTISPEQVTNWISFCAFLVQFSQSVDETLLRTFLQRHAASTDLSIGEICSALGMWEVSRYFGNLPQFGEDWDEWEEVVDPATAPSAENAPRRRGALGQLLSSRVTRVLPFSR